ncbi:MAG: hypothetical protein R2706_13740 [Acidimicrobiales bacterium]
MATELADATNDDENLLLANLVTGLSAASGNHEAARASAQWSVELAAKAGLVVSEGVARLEMAQALVRLERPAEALVELEKIDPNRLGSSERRQRFLLMAELAEQQSDWDTAAAYWSDAVALASRACRLPRRRRWSKNSPIIWSRCSLRVPTPPSSRSSDERCVIVTVCCCWPPRPPWTLASMNLASQLLAAGSDRESLLPKLNALSQSLISLRNS